MALREGTLGGRWNSPVVGLGQITSEESNDRRSKGRMLVEDTEKPRPAALGGSQGV